MTDVELEAGDFLYQTDQELFLVVMEERDDSYLFAAHGWRDIGKDRLEEYVDGAHGKLHTQEQFEEVIDQEGDDKIRENYKELKDLFKKYSDDFNDDGPADEFAMEDS